MFRPRSTRGRSVKPARQATTTSNTIAREWIGGRLAAPIYITEGTPYRPEMILWLELPENLLVGYKVLEPNAPAATVLQTLRTALEKPLAGRPRRPTRIRVADETLAAELRAAVADIEVVVAPTPELDGLMAHMSNRMPMGDEAESYFERGRVSAAAVKQLFRAAKQLWHAAPWKRIHDGTLLNVDIPALGLNGGCLSIIGGLGEELGFLLFPSVQGFEQFARAAERPQLKAIDLGTTILSLNFDRSSDLPPSMRQEALKHRWPVASPKAYPRVEHRDRDAVPRPLSERDVLVATAIATSLTALFAQHGAALASELSKTICESYFDDDQREVRFTAPADPARLFAANDAPDKAAPTTATTRPNVHEEDDRLVNEMMRFAVGRFRERWLQAARVFADVDAAMPLFVPWSVYHFEVNGRPVVDWFLVEEKQRMTPHERAWLEAQQRAWLTVWEVMAVEPGKSVTVRDLLSGEERLVHEQLASKELVIRDALLARIVEHDGSSVFCGMYPRSLPTPKAAEVVERVRGKLRKKSAIAVEKLRDESVGRYVIASWEKAVKEYDAGTLQPPQLANTDGDDMLFTTDHFVVDPASRAEVERRLGDIKDVERPNQGDPKPRFTFLKQGNAMHHGWDNTVLGSGWMTAAGLKLETNSIPRANALRLRIEKACGELVRHRAREHSDPVALMAAEQGPKKRTSGSKAPRDSDETRQLLRDFKERHYAGWLDEKLPALNGKTPREAVRAKTSRQRVHLLLKDIEDHEARLPESERFDCSKLRRELELPR